jgi:hypothetical protein
MAIHIQYDYTNEHKALPDFTVLLDSCAACETSMGGTCINAHYNSCLDGFYVYMSYCGFQEMCCVPPIHHGPEPPLAHGKTGRLLCY